MTLALSPVETFDRAERPDRTHPELPDDGCRDGGGVLGSRHLESVLTFR